MAIDVATNDGASVTRNVAAPVASAKILRLPQVRAVTGFGRSMIYQMEAEGRFPHRVHIGVRAVGWVESDVQDWLRQRIDSGRPRKA